MKDKEISPALAVLYRQVLVMAAGVVLFASACGPSTEAGQGAPETGETVLEERAGAAAGDMDTAVGKPSEQGAVRATAAPASSKTAVDNAADPGNGESAGQVEPLGINPERGATGPTATAVTIPAATLATAATEAVAEESSTPGSVPVARSEPVGGEDRAPATVAEAKEPVDAKAAEPEIVTPPGIYTAPEFRGIVQWINSDPLTMEDLRGKVVLIDFWTYSCINCQRTLPYIRDWHNKYGEMGLVVVGVHAPEFEFEHKEANVRKAVADQDVTWAVAMDNGFQTWRAYQNRWWPHKFLIDQQGTIRFHHIGEGAYRETELHIRNLLGEGGVDVSGIEVGGITEG